MVQTITMKYVDPLRCDEPRLVDRLRHVAEYAINKVNEGAVQEEVAILRAPPRRDPTGSIPACGAQR